MQYASVRADYPDLDNGRIHILPQGPPELPPAPERREIEPEVVGRRHVNHAAGADKPLGLLDFVAQLFRVGRIRPLHGLDQDE